MRFLLLLLFLTFVTNEVKAKSIAGKERTAEEEEIIKILEQLKNETKALHPRKVKNKIANLIKKSHDLTGQKVRKHPEQTSDPSLFEGDIKLSLPQAKRVYNHFKRRHGTPTKSKRQAIVDHYWSKTIAYTIEDSSIKDNAIIAINYVANNTCLGFKQRTSEADYIAFVKKEGCWSNVGNSGGRNELSVDSWCTWASVTHELLHALGLWHEQSRTDRDDYVSVIYDNIETDEQYNFMKIDDSTNLGEAYDYGSIMHYHGQSFTSNGEDTLKATNAAFQNTMGQRAGMSFKDVKMLNVRYCGDVCPTQLQCYYGGYADPKSCKQCRCPEGTTGAGCAQVAKSELATCGVSDLKITHNGYSKGITINNKGKGKCFYRIQAPVNRKILVNIDKHNFPCEVICESYVEVKYSSDSSTTGARICCGTHQFESEDPELIIIVNHNDDSQFNTEITYWT